MLVDEPVTDGPDLVSGIVVYACDDTELSAYHIRTIQEGKKYMKYRTKEVPTLGVVYGNFEYTIK